MTDGFDSRFMWEDEDMNRAVVDPDPEATKMGFEARELIEGKVTLTPKRVHCGFYSCKEIGTLPARFVHEKIILDVMLCEAHDRYTKQGGQLAILFDRALVPERQP